MARENEVLIDALCVQILCGIWFWWFWNPLLQCFENDFILTLFWAFSLYKNLWWTEWLMFCLFCRGLELLRLGKVTRVAGEVIYKWRNKITWIWTIKSKDTLFFLKTEFWGRTHLRTLNFEIYWCWNLFMCLLVVIGLFETLFDETLMKP